MWRQFIKRLKHDIQEYLSVINIFTDYPSFLDRSHPFYLFLSNSTSTFPTSFYVIYGTLQKRVYFPPFTYSSHFLNTFQVALGSSNSLKFPLNTHLHLSHLILYTYFVMQISSIRTAMKASIGQLKDYSYDGLACREYV